MGRMIASIVSFCVGLGFVATLVFSYSELSSVPKLAGLVFGAAVFGIIIPATLVSGRN